ncbi:type VI secretion system tube protein TssD, partial [Rahnella woolbedingensis]
MANLIYVKIIGQKQGLISAGCSTYDSVGNRFQRAHRDEIIVLHFDHEIVRSQNVKHRPVSFIKLIDKSTPLIGMAIASNEKMDLFFDFYRTSSVGAQEKHFTIEVRGATIERHSIRAPHLLDAPDKEPEEMISVVYE